MNWGWFPRDVLGEEKALSPSVLSHLNLLTLSFELVMMFYSHLLKAKIALCY